MSVREIIKNQIVAHLKDAEFPIETPDVLLGSFPNGADTTCKAGELIITAGQAGTLLNNSHFPFNSAEEVGETIVELAKL
ncbi:MTH865 family protein [Vallitalea okinawensis]|uniref:MTH865 family protein n=1 Tax=Vallitalea okinawensis TaxID=2078660 RepID=UPI000CFBE45F|nr:MTH865 family protein [Vallitalea okinawensis]